MRREEQGEREAETSSGRQKIRTASFIFLSNETEALSEFPAVCPDVNDIAH